MESSPNSFEFSSLIEARAQLDAIDLELMATLQKRMELVVAVQAWKKQHDISAFDPEREKQIIENLQRDFPKIPPKVVKDIYQIIFANVCSANL